MNKALQAELQRVREVYQPDAAAFRERLALHDQHVQAFTAMLRPLVAEALTAEIPREVSTDWLAQARLAARGMLAADSGTSAAQEQAERELARDLAAHLAEGSLLPDDHEIAQHAGELAQLLLSNWTALLEHALEDEPRLELVNALPSTAPSDRVVLGVEAFALSVLAAGQALARYQAGLAEREEVVALTPTVHVFCLLGQWRATRTREDAQAWLGELRERALQEAIAAMKRAAEKVTRTVTPVAIARVSQRTAHAWVEQAPLPIGTEVELASDIAVCVLSDRMQELATLPRVARASLNPGMIKLIQSDLKTAFCDTDDFLFDPWRTWPMMASPYDDLIDDGSFYRVSLLASGLVFVARQRQLPVRRLAHWACSRLHDFQVDHKVVAMMTGTVQAVMSDPEVEHLASLVGAHHAAPSQFGGLWPN